MRTLATLFRPIRRLSCDSRAVAAVEFALILPVMLTAYLGTVDAGHGISADRKLAAATAILGDLSSQANTTLPAGTLESYFQAAEAAMRPFSGEDTAQRLTIVSVTGGTATVRESRVYNGAEALLPGTPISVPADVRAVAREHTLIVAEGWYTYQPVIGYVFKTPLTLSKREFFVPRYDGGIDIVGSL